jgi:hypothetical protein
MYYLRTRSAVDALKGFGIDMSTTKPVEQPQTVNTVVTPTNNQIISENTPELVMTSERPTDSPFECEGCGS